jgi:hypothetical protein
MIQRMDPRALAAESGREDDERSDPSVGGIRGPLAGADREGPT